MPDTILQPERLQKRRRAVRDVLDAHEVAHFEADELYRHHSEVWPWDALYPPPTGLAENIGETVELADEIRERWGGKVKVPSGFRVQVYNDLIRLADNEHQGAEDSQHLYFRALDLQPVHPRRPDYSAWREHCVQIVEERRAAGQIVGCGLYSTFVHIDTGRYSYSRSWPNEGRYQYEKVRRRVAA